MSEIGANRINYLDAVTRAAQYFASMRPKADRWTEFGDVVHRFFGAELVAIASRQPDAPLSLDYTSITEPAARARLLEAVRSHAAPVLDSGFLSTETLELPESYSVALLPLAQDQRRDILLVVGHQTTAPLPMHLLDIYLAVARLMESTLARLGYEEQLRFRAREQACIAMIGHKALEGSALPDLMGEVVKGVAKTLRVEYCALLELQPNGSAFLLRAGFGWSEGCVGNATVDADPRTQPGYTLHSGKSTVEKNVRAEETFVNPPLFSEHGIASSAVVSLAGRERAKGVMSVHSTVARTFTKEEVNFLQSAANVVAAAWERRQAEEALRASETRYRSLFENMPDGYALHEILLDEKGKPCDYRFLEVNSAFEELLGLERRAILGKTVLEILPGTEPYWIEAYGRVALTGEGMRIERYSCEFDRYFNVSVFPSERGVFAVVFTDVSQRRKSEEALRKSESRLAQAQRIARIGSWELDLVNDALLWSNEIYQIFEIDKERFEASYEAFLAAIHPEDREAVSVAYEESVKNHETYSIDHRLLLPDGRVKYVHEQCENFYDEDGRPLRSLGTVQDITERKQAEEKLRQASLHARSLIEASLDPLVTISAEGKITDVNAATIRATGVPRERLIGTDFSDYFTEPAKARAGYNVVFEKGFVTDYPLTIRHRDGQLTEVMYNASLYRDERGVVLGIFAAARDVTESNRIHRELVETRNFLDNILQSSTRYSIIGMDLEQRILSWNEGARRNYGYSAEEVYGRHLRLLHVPEDLVSGAVDRLLATAYEKGMAEGEFQRVRKDGSRFIASVTVTRRDDPAGRPIGYLIVSSDITERKRAEEALRATQQQMMQSEKLAALGTLAAGVAHELNNPLMGIMNYVGFALKREKDTEIRYPLERADEELKRIRDLLRNMLMFARPATGSLSAIDLNLVLRRTSELLAPEFRARQITFSQDIQEGLPQVTGKAGPLQQVFLNLLLNARDAVEESSERRVVLRAYANDVVTVEVRDSGEGIPKEIQGRLFDPFFTTKPPGKGTGLGLSIVQTTVSELGGRVEVVSSPAVGTTFTVRLPKAQEAAAARDSG